MIHVELRWHSSFGCLASSPEQDQYFRGASTFAAEEGLSKTLTDLCRYERHESIAGLKVALIARAHAVVGATLDANVEVLWMKLDPLDRDIAAEIERRNTPPAPPPPPKPRLPMVRSALVDARLRCDACTNWVLPGGPSQHAPSIHHGGCGRAPFGSRDNEDEGSVVTDYEDYGADLWTLPDFGCVLFEEKES